MATNKKGAKKDMGLAFCHNCDKWIEPGGHDHWEVKLLEDHHENKAGQTVHVCEWCADALVEDGIGEYVVDRMAL